MNQGTLANITGARLEKRVEMLLLAYGIEHIKQDKYTSIYGNTAKMDFYIPSLDLAIECKNQEVSGSVAEKIPYVMATFEQHSAKNSLLVLGGKYWVTKPGIRLWAEQTAAKSYKNIKILYESELGDWLEQTGFRQAA